MRVAVMGLGYVGTVSAACLASHGNDVWGVDIDDHKVAAISRGLSPVIEPGLGEMVDRAVRSGSLHATGDPGEALAGADVSFICVGTPSSDNGATDLSYVARASEQIAEALGARAESERLHVVVVRSTVPPGTVESLVGPAMRETGGTVGTAMCPEFLREGSGIADFFDPPFTIIGTEDGEVAQVLSSLFSFLDAPVRVVPVRVAESLKYACNAFHATKVVFANEMARVLGPMGIDSRAVMSIFCEDGRLNISPSYLRPGFAFGGPCLPKDLRSLLHLARMQSVDLPMLSGVITSNEVVVQSVVNRITATDGRTVALIGLSFKASSDDLRESPNVRMAETLVGKGYEVRIYDPVVQPSQLIGTNLRYVESKLPHLRRLMTDDAASAVEGADLAVVASTDSTAVAALLARPPRRILDLTGGLGPEVEALEGYEGIGW